LSLCWICSSDNLHFYEAALPALFAAAGRDMGAPGLLVGEDGAVGQHRP
jgi:hypothetical protein